MQEIIFNKPEKHLIFIDDAHCFGNPDYPEYPSMEEPTKCIDTFNKQHNLIVEDDIISIELL